MVRGKLIALSAFRKKLNREHTCSLTAHLKAVEQSEANIHKRSRSQVIIQLRAEINQGERKRSIQRINYIQINKIRNEKGDITTEAVEIQKCHHKNLLQKFILN